MQTIEYTVGQWHAQAQVEELGPDRLMAVISVTDENGESGCASRHTVVFEPAGGQDRRAETEQLVQKLLRERYGA